jgi:hypothetical protein
MGFGDPEGGGGESEASEHILLPPPIYAKASIGKPAYLTNEALIKA